MASIVSRPIVEHPPVVDSMEDGSNSLASARVGFAYRISLAVTVRFHMIRFLTFTVLFIFDEGVGLKTPSIVFIGALNCFVLYNIPFTYTSIIVLNRITPILKGFWMGTFGIITSSELLFTFIVDTIKSFVLGISAMAMLYSLRLSVRNMDDVGTGTGPTLLGYLANRILGDDT